ncbi:hypothetical protein SEA_RICKMORE_34 [Gordonia phage Rickmore]|uniref:Uncharacterized protein n=1 Tax=Gordonia phage Rickmore TaxID=2507854 RepID=A0A410TB31_9CAUD|nr:hypothetical protein HWC05_gp34 [Gordonia phage Rickmore]QAU06269.1 hypothetical protein SEA_RICKMORE_34 [Gordonia phage Rickmore]
MVHLKPAWYKTKPWDRHGLILVTVGIIYTAIGIMYSLQPTTELRAQNLKYALSIMPYLGWCIGFVLVGILTVVTSRWPLAPKSLGYSVLSGWTAAWAGFHVIGGIAADNTAYIASGFAWAMIGFLWWAISGLISPPKERMTGGSYTIGHIAGCSNCGSVCVCNTETGLESEPSGSDGEPSGDNGDRSL